MPRNTELLHARNQHVIARFKHHRKRNPKWRVEAVLEEVSGEVFLSTITIVKILKQENERVPDASTLYRAKQKAVA